MLTLGNMHDVISKQQNTHSDGVVMGTTIRLKECSSQTVKIDTQGGKTRDLRVRVRVRDACRTIRSSDVG